MNFQFWGNSFFRFRLEKLQGKTGVFTLLNAAQELWMTELVFEFNQVQSLSEVGVGLFAVCFFFGGGGCVLSVNAHIYPLNKKK